MAPKEGSETGVVPGDYPTGDSPEGRQPEVPEPAKVAVEPKQLSLAEEDLLSDLTYDELKRAFRLFDNEGLGFIPVERFRIILKEVDEDFTEDELDDIIFEVDADGSGTIDFDEFVKIMT